MVESVVTVFLFNFWYHLLSTMFLVTISRPNQYMIDSIPQASWSSIFTYVSSHTRRGYILFIRWLQLENMDVRDILIVTADAKAANSAKFKSCLQKEGEMQSSPIWHDSIRKICNYILPASQHSLTVVVLSPSHSSLKDLTTYPNSNQTCSACLQQY